MAFDTPFLKPKLDDASAVPIAHATPTQRQPIDQDALRRLVSSYAGQTTGHLYRGPGWVTDEGTACVVLIASDETAIKRIHDHGQCGFVAWRWNGAPAAPLSLTLITRHENPRPHVRWMRASEDPVVQAVLFVVYCKRTPVPTEADRGALASIASHRFAEPVLLTSNPVWNPSTHRGDGAVPAH